MLAVTLVSPVGVDVCAYVSMHMFRCTMVGLKDLGIVGDFSTLSKTKATSDLCGMAVLIGYKN
jgi:hypothetical protein